MNQLQNLPKSPQQIKNQYERGLVSLGYEKNNLPPLWIYNLYQATRGGKKLNDPNIPYYTATNHNIAHFAGLIKSNNLLGPSGKPMTVLEYMEETYDKKDTTKNTGQMSPLSAKIQFMSQQSKKPEDKKPDKPTLEDKLAELRKRMPNPNPSTNPLLRSGAMQDIEDLKKANPQIPKPALSPSPYRGPSR